MEPAPRPPPRPLRPTPQAGAINAPAPVTPAQPATAAAVVDRDTAIAATPRVKIETPSLTGSISLKGARIDDLSLVKFRETVDPASPAIVLYSPSGTAEPYYAEFGWVAVGRLDGQDFPTRTRCGSRKASGSLTPIDAR